MYSDVQLLYIVIVFCKNETTVMANSYWMNDNSCIDYSCSSSGSDSSGAYLHVYVMLYNHL